MSLIPALRRTRQTILCEFEASLQREFQESQGYAERSCLKNRKIDRQTERYINRFPGIELSMQAIAEEKSYRVTTKCPLPGSCIDELISS